MADTQKNSHAGFTVPAYAMIRCFSFIMDYNTLCLPLKGISMPCAKKTHALPGNNKTTRRCFLICPVVYPLTESAICSPLFHPGAYPTENLLLQFLHWNKGKESFSALI